MLKVIGKSLNGEIDESLNIPFNESEALTSFPTNQEDSEEAETYNNLRFEADNREVKQETVALGNNNFTDDTSNLNRHDSSNTQQSTNKNSTLTPAQTQTRTPFSVTQNTEPRKKRIFSAADIAPKKVPPQQKPKLSMEPK